MTPDPPRFMATSDGSVIQELGADGKYRFVGRIADGGGECIARLLNAAAQLVPANEPEARHAA